MPLQSLSRPSQTSAFARVNDAGNSVDAIDRSASAVMRALNASLKVIVPL
jgi:hypothetical protein